MANVNEDELPAAIKCFDFILSSSPQHQDNIEVLKILAHLYAKKKSHEEKAVALFRQCLDSEDDNQDVEMMVELAQLLETRNVDESIQLYKKANTILINKGEVSLQLLNNMAALLQSVGDLDNALRTFRKALSLAESKQNLAWVTIKYNLARLLEKLEQIPEAEVMYRDILDKHPTYVDGLCILN